VPDGLLAVGQWGRRIQGGAQTGDVIRPIEVCRVLVDAARDRT
jgi:hypothetical protein